MIQEERHQEIIKAVNERGFLSVDEIMSMLNISRSTVRRDLEDLADAQLLIRARGGAVSLRNGTAHEPPVEQRRDSQLEEKKRIAELAINLIHERDTILLDSGTTSFELARLLDRFKHLMVATYDLNIANELRSYRNIDLVVSGGLLRKGASTLVGYLAEMIFNQIHADTFFLAVDAIDLDHGCMNFCMEEITSKKAMLKAAKRTIVLCDHTKFETIAFINTCSLDDVDIIITDRGASPEVVDKLREMGIEVMLA